MAVFLVFFAGKGGKESGSFNNDGTLPFEKESSETTIETVSSVTSSESGDIILSPEPMTPTTEADSWKCENCGSIMKNENKFCEECGLEKGKWKCEECGAVMDGEDRFCEECGLEKGKWKCANCGAAMDQGNQFCEECGTRRDSQSAK